MFVSLMLVEPYLFIPLLMTINLLQGLRGVKKVIVLNAFLRRFLNLILSSQVYMFDCRMHGQNQITLAFLSLRLFGGGGNFGGRFSDKRKLCGALTD